MIENEDFKSVVKIDLDEKNRNIKVRGVFYMILEENQINNIIIISEDNKKIDKYLSNKYKYFKTKSKKNILYIIQDEFSKEVIDIEDDFKNLKELIGNKFLLINKLESGNTGDIEIHYYFGDKMKEESFYNFESYYGDIDYTDEIIKNQNVIKEINQFISNINLSEKEEKLLSKLGFHINKKNHEYKPSEIYTLKLEEGENTIYEIDIKKLQKAKIVIFPESLERFESNIGDCKIEKIIVNKELKYICRLAFMRLKKLEEIAFDCDLEETGVDLFMGCQNLKIVDLSKTKLNVLEDIFADCISLEKVFLPQTITQINEFNNSCIFKDSMNVTIYSNSSTVIEYANKYNIKIEKI